MKKTIKLLCIGIMIGMVGSAYADDGKIIDDLATYELLLEEGSVGLATIDDKTLSDLVDRAAMYDVIYEGDRAKLAKIAHYAGLRKALTDELERRMKKAPSRPEIRPTPPPKPPVLPRYEAPRPETPSKAPAVPVASSRDKAADATLFRLRIWDKKDLTTANITQLQNLMNEFVSFTANYPERREELVPYKALSVRLSAELKRRAAGGTMAPPIPAPAPVLRPVAPVMPAPLSLVPAVKKVSLLTNDVVRKCGLNNLFSRLAMKEPGQPQLVYVRMYGPEKKSLLLGPNKKTLIPGEEGISYRDAAQWPQVVQIPHVDRRATWDDERILAQPKVIDQFELVGAYGSCPAMSFYTAYNSMAFAMSGNEEYLRDLVDQKKAKEFFIKTGSLQAAEFFALQELYDALIAGKYADIDVDIFKNLVTVVPTVRCFDKSQQKPIVGVYPEIIMRINNVIKDLQSKDSYAHAFVILTSDDEVYFTGDTSQHYFTFVVLKQGRRIQYLVLDSMPNFYHLYAHSFMLARLQFMIECLEGKTPTIALIPKDAVPHLGK